MKLRRCQSQVQAGWAVCCAARNQSVESEPAASQTRCLTLTKSLRKIDKRIRGLGDVDGRIRRCLDELISYAQIAK